MAILSDTLDDGSCAAGNMFPIARGGLAVQWHADRFFPPQDYLLANMKILSRGKAEVSDQYKNNEIYWGQEISHVPVLTKPGR